MTNIRNLIIFAFYCLIRLIPPWKWAYYWNLVWADHVAKTRKAIWELKCQGKVAEDREGRLYSKR